MNSPITNETQVNIQPSLEIIREVLSVSKNLPNAPNVVPLCATIPADFLTPTLAYVKISAKLFSRYHQETAGNRTEH